MDGCVCMWDVCVCIYLCRCAFSTPNTHNTVEPAPSHSYPRICLMSSLSRCSRLLGHDPTVIICKATVTQLLFEIQPPGTAQPILSSGHAAPLCVHRCSRISSPLPLLVRWGPTHILHTVHLVHACSLLVRAPKSGCIVLFWARCREETLE